MQLYHVGIPSCIYGVGILSFCRRRKYNLDDLPKIYKAEMEFRCRDKYLTDGFSLGELKSVLDTLMLKFGLHLRRRQYRDDIVIGRQMGRELCRTMKTKQT